MQRTSKSMTKKSTVKKRTERTWKGNLNMEKRMKHSKITATRSLSMKSTQRMKGQAKKSQV